MKLSTLLAAASAIGLIAESWDACRAPAHWRQRRSGQPFFAVFNLMETHQSKVFESSPAPNLDPALLHEPDRAPMPPYFPNTPRARRTMARVHDCITAMDRRAGEILTQLEQDGLAGDTIVFFWSDHGQGIPRGKRTLWDSGLKVPLVIAFPEKYQHLAAAMPGGSCERLVSLMDLGPTLLSLVDLPIPPTMQGRAFLGTSAARARDYVFGARDRVDEAAELARSVRDGRYLYIRNFLPDLSWNQPESYSDQLKMRVEITQLAAAGRLNDAQLAYAATTKPVELLYDTQADPWQINNLAMDAGHQAVLQRLRRTLREWQAQTCDQGLRHETEAAHTGMESSLERAPNCSGRSPTPPRRSSSKQRGFWWRSTQIGLRSNGRKSPATTAASQRASSTPRLPATRSHACSRNGRTWIFCFRSPPTPTSIGV